MTTITINLTHAKDGWVANVTEMPGCITQGNDLHDVLDMIEDAMRGWADLTMQEVQNEHSIWIDRPGSWAMLATKKDHANPVAKVVDADSKRIHPAAPTLYRYMIVYNIYDNAFHTLHGEDIGELLRETRIMSFADLKRIAAGITKIPAGTHAQVTNYKLMAIQQNGIWVPA